MFLLLSLFLSFFLSFFLIHFVRIIFFYLQINFEEFLDFKYHIQTKNFKV
jgi:hypothetical protein